MNRGSGGETATRRAIAQVDERSGLRSADNCADSPNEHMKTFAPNFVAWPRAPSAADLIQMAANIVSTRAGAFGIEAGGEFN
jgi:hypothetical protein